MVGEIAPKDLQEKLKAGEELAFLDVREQGVHAQGHPFWAVPLPLSILELRVEELVPRKTVPVYLLDQGEDEDLADRAAEVLLSLGYTNLHIVVGGIAGWQTAGLEIFSGVNVPSKAFGEFVEHHNGTPHITADELAARLADGEDIRIFDSRPLGEFKRMSIPGGVDMPGAELVHRIYEAVPDAATPIVVNCAGRTRSIIGAQSLINAGIPNPVMALKDGTMGWYLAGHKLSRGSDACADMPSSDNLQKSIRAARAVAEQAGATALDAEGLLKLKEQQNVRSLFLLDVRTEEEFLKERVAGSRHAPGGQLVQATDEYVGVRGATLVLFDDREVRAWMTASWLKQIGWEHVHVMTDFSGQQMQSGPVIRSIKDKAPEISALELDAVIASGEAAAVIDVGNSLDYRAGHVPGAYWAIRSRVQQDLTFLPPVGYIVVTAKDPARAHLAVPDIAHARPDAIVHVLQGGNDSWRVAGLSFEEGDTRLLSRQDDLWYKPYDNKEKIRERMQEYLDWEVALVSQVERDGTAGFKVIS